MHVNTTRTIVFAALFGVALCSAADVLASNSLAGTWRINLEETDKVTVEFEEGSGIQGGNMGRTSVSVMGLPLPSRAKAAPMSSLPAKDPEVLLCSEMNLSVEGKKVTLAYDNGNIETLREGEYRGRTTRLSRNEIEQKYKTTERRVRKTWTLRDDGRLLVAVRIKYQGDKARTYNRVFDRVAAGVN
jgi:hypothetical protein